MIYTYCYFNGKILPLSEASLPLNDLSVIRGYAVFDFLRTYYKKPFLLSDYLERFFASAHSMRLSIKESKEEIQNAILKLLEINSINNEVGIRLALTGGTSEDGFTLTGPPNFFILIESLRYYPGDIQSTGIKLITHEYQRNYSHVKTTNYITAVNLQEMCKANQAADVLFVRGGLVLETTRNNFFLIKDNRLVTPKENVLIGRTRNFLLSIADKLIAKQERDIQMSELDTADEIFIIGTSKGIIPVTKIDDRIISSGLPGPITLRLISLFDQEVMKIQKK